MSKGELHVSRWLEAHSNRNLQLSVLPRSLILVDVSGDEDYQLVLADFIYNRLRAYKRILNWDNILCDLPNSLISFYTNHLEPSVPAVAVACRADLFIFKNNKPFFKFRIPSSPILPLEANFWEKLTNGSISFDINKSLEEINTIPLTLLSGRSQELLTTASPENVIKRYQHKPLTKESPITCMCTIKKSSFDKKALSCPVLATESGNIYFLDSQTLAILQQANTCSRKSTPFIISAIGLFDVDYKIIIGCREGHICVLMKGWLEGKLITEFLYDIIDLVIVPGDNFIVVATSQQTLSCISKRGQNLWSAKTMSPVTCLCLVPIGHLNVNLIAVGLRGGTIQLYHGRHIVDYTTVPETPATIAFGQLGQEENVLVTITLGTMSYKILKRTADFNVRFKENVPSLQCKPIPLPKRSKLFLEQSLRERTMAMEMHQFFQQDLMRMRLKNASELVDSIDNLENKAEFKMEAKVLGLGPKFTIVLTLENLNARKCIKDMSVIFHANAFVSYLSPNVIKVPIMPPCYRYKVKMQLTQELHQNEVQMTAAPSVKIYAARHSCTRPDLAVTLTLPVTDRVLCF